MLHLLEYQLKSTSPPTHHIKEVDRVTEQNFIWVMISAILLTIMRDESFGLDALSCLSRLALVITGFVLVDDTDIINATKSVNTTGEWLLKKQQNVVDTLKGTLRETGGALRPYKSYWYMIVYQHIGKRWVYRSIDQLSREITVKVSDSSRQPLLQLRPNQAKETLGIFVSMNGNAKDQISHLLSKTRQLTEHLHISQVEKKKRGIYLHQFSWKRLNIQWMPPDSQKCNGKKWYHHFFQSLYRSLEFQKKSKSYGLYS